MKTKFAALTLSFCNTVIGCVLLIPVIGIRGVIGVGFLVASCIFWMNAK